MTVQFRSHTQLNVKIYTFFGTAQRNSITMEIIAHYSVHYE